MKTDKKIKLCKGFDCDLCRACKRQNDEAERLVKKLATGRTTDKKYCQFYLH